MERASERERIFRNIVYIVYIHTATKNTISMRSVGRSIQCYFCFIHTTNTHIRPWTMFAEFILHDCVPVTHRRAVCMHIWIASFTYARFACVRARARLLTPALYDFLRNFRSILYSRRNGIKYAKTKTYLSHILSVFCLLFAVVYRINSNVVQGTGTDMGTVSSQYMYIFQSFSHSLILLRNNNKKEPYIHRSIDTDAFIRTHTLAHIHQFDGNKFARQCIQQHL